MDAIKIHKILKKHKLWLEGKDNGERADLHGANLRCADLHGAGLRWADLHSANLCNADLSNADLRHADLSNADLRYTDLRGANLREANLCRASLRGADLSGADIDFSTWPMWCGGLGVKVDKRIIAQLAYHFCSLVCVDDDDTVNEAFLQARAALLPLANQFHRTDVPRLE